MRTLAIGDIHGCSHSLTTLLDYVGLRPDDQVITLGDYVDRGPDSRGVIDTLLGLHARGQLVALRGNHEEMMLVARAQGYDIGMWLASGGEQTLESYGATDPDVDDLALVPQAHWDFLNEVCVDFHETETHFFVHANAYPDMELAEQPTYMLRWEKLYGAVPHCSGKIMVCGHTPQLDGLPRNFGCAVCIDTGVYRPGGWLTCFEPQTGRYWQANQEGQTREGLLDDPEDL